MVQRMTDPVTNVEIEDVLSSIRRLVSDDARVMKPVQNPLKQPEKLVLTPALRVSDDDLAPVSREDAGDADLAPQPDMDSAESQDDNAPILLTDLAPLVEEAAPEGVALDDVVEEQDVDPESDEALLDVEPDEPAGTEIDEDADEAVASAVDELKAGLEDEAETAVEVLIDDGALLQIVEQEVGEALADMVAAEDVAAEDLDTAEEVSQPGSYTQAAQIENLHEALNDVLGGEAEDVVDQDDEVEPLASATDDSLEDKIAALEALVGRDHAQDWEPEEPANDAKAPIFQRSSEVLDWQDAEDAEQNAAKDDNHDDVQSARAEVEQMPGGGAADMSSTEPLANADLLTIDETVLRSMVSEIVRQELQGALGERITRNVRKLVRREINRVLMSQDFD